MRNRGFSFAAFFLLLTLPCFADGGAAPTSGHAVAEGQAAGAPTPQANNQPKVGSPAGTPAAPPLTEEQQADLLNGQVQKLMVQCANLLAGRDPLALKTCKRQRDLADQYPGHRLAVDRVLAHDEYGIALAVFDRKREALAEFNEEIRLLPAALKPGSVPWSTAYWHRAMIYTQLGELGRANRDYNAAEKSLRRQQRMDRSPHPSSRLRTVLRQHAALLEKQGKHTESQKLLREAAQ